MMQETAGTLRVATRRLTWLAIALVSGCASASGGAQGNIQLNVQNEYRTVVTAYIQWDGRTPVRLGEVSPRSEEIFNVDRRGRDVRVVFARLGSGSPSTRVTGDNRLLQTREGDRFLWVLRSDGYTVFAQRLDDF